MEKLKEYQRINNSFKKGIIFRFGKVGIYSELNNMIIVMLYCLQKKIKFSLYSKDAVFMLGNGWTDYFLPFCEESKNIFHSKLNTRDDLSIVSRGARFVIFLYRIVFHNTLLTYDVFYRARATWFQRSHFDIPELGIKGDLRAAARSLIDIVYRFNPVIDAEIKTLISSINLPEQYISIHIRGGDKIIEHELMSINQYIEKAQLLSSNRNVFVLTDDYRIYNSLIQNFPQWNFYTLTMSDETGYNHPRFIKSNNDRKKKEMLKVFASIELIKKSEIFIGTFSSNPGMFIGMCMPKDKVFGVDYDKWMVF